jgi:peptide/nickel transport system substrate-binding protein
MRRRTLLTGAAALSLARPGLAQKPAVLRFVPQANLTSLDPIWTTAIVTANHGYYVWDTLYAVDSQLRPQPQMAEGHTTEDDGLTWRIRLRDGLKFHDGTLVRALDCGASLERWSQRDPFGQLMAKFVDRYETPDDRTLVIRLKRQFPLLLSALSRPDANVPFIMPERIARTDPNKAFVEVIGSGPYRFIPGDYVSGSRVAYEKFEGYVPRQEPPSWAAGGKVAYFPRIEWNIIPDSATAAAALQNGEVDWWEQPLPDLLPSFARAGIQLEVNQPMGWLSVMRLNTLQPPFDDVRLRRAVLASVSQEEYMRATFGDDTSLWHTCFSLYSCTTPLADETVGRRLMTGDLDEAGRMLKQAGYAGQKAVIINPSDFPAIEPLGQVTYDRLRKMGMNVNLAESDWGTVVQRRASKAPVDKGGWSIFHTFGSAVAYSNPVVSTLVRGQGEAGWYGWWKSPEAESLVDEYVAASDQAQKPIAEKIQSLALEGVATVPLGQFFIKTAFRKSITGVLPGISPYPWHVRPT